MLQNYIKLKYLKIFQILIKKLKNIFNHKYYTIQISFIIELYI